MTILVVGGGTGGHLFAATALADELIKRKHKPILITDYRCKKYIDQDSPFKYHLINSFQVRGKWYSKFVALFKISTIILKLLIMYTKLKPKLIIGFGGYPTFAPLTAARILNIPFIIHEQNCFLGKVNYYHASKALKIAVAFQGIKNLKKEHEYKTINTGNPVRQHIKNLNITRDFNTRPFKLLVIGGSQGAKIFNKIIPNALKLVKAKVPNLEISIYHQAVKEDWDRLEKIYQKLGIEYEIEDFFNDIDQKYINSQLAICRAGASTIAELIHTGLPSIMIPLPHSSQNHQLLNAKMLSQQNASWYFKQNTLNPNMLATKLIKLINSPNMLEDASKNLISSRTNAEKVLADTIEEVLKI